MRKLIFLPSHMRERMLKFRTHNGIMDEQHAILRLLESGLRVEEERYLEEKAMNKKNPEESI